jgi:hypothetical protein
MPDKRILAQRGLVEVTFTLPPQVTASAVELVGDFTSWTAVPMDRREDGGWETRLELAPGRSYQYRFRIDGDRWENDWEADEYRSNDFGQDNSVLHTPSLDAMTLEATSQTPPRPADSGDESPAGAARQSAAAPKKSGAARKSASATATATGKASAAAPKKSGAARKSASASAPKKSASPAKKASPGGAGGKASPAAGKKKGARVDGGKPPAGAGARKGDGAAARTKPAGAAKAEPGRASDGSVPDASPPAPPTAEF